MSATTIAVAVAAEIIGRTGFVAVVMMVWSSPPPEGSGSQYKMPGEPFQPVLRLFPA
jgi:hypothetical protein